VTERASGQRRSLCQAQVTLFGERWSRTRAGPGWSIANLRQPGWPRLYGSPSLSMPPARWTRYLYRRDSASGVSIVKSFTCKCVSNLGRRPRRCAVRPLHHTRTVPGRRIRATWNVRLPSAVLTSLTVLAAAIAEVGRRPCRLFQMVGHRFASDHQRGITLGASALRSGADTTGRGHSA